MSRVPLLTAHVLRDGGGATTARARRQVPQPRCAARNARPARDAQDTLKDSKQASGDLEITLIAGEVERNQNVVG
jgi:hypothetical protein